ncbi:odorant receptor 85b-like isoform X2 [Hermetia illucens]|nr:odorant receptor 85b-like isoform X2 [Hermetia illucens]XP_037902561.1 odorant receptor 85b-like isoform X2 [Hermetia illucens]
MHFDFISRQLLEMVPRGGPNDMRCLKQLIQHHVTILRFSEETNDVFGISSLCTFLSSSPIICFTGFQVSIGAANRVIGKYILFLIHQSLTVFAVCYHGNIVIDSSLEVADAAYGQHWFQASKEYKKMLLILITRANNPSTLKATSFVTASLMTFSSIISTSYQFFALVRTMYSDG